MTEVRRAGRDDSGGANGFLTLLVAPSVLLLGLFFLAPLINLARLSLFERPVAGGFYVADSFTLDHYRRIFSDDYYLHVLLATVRLSAIVTLLSLLIAYPLALLVYRAGPGLKSALLLTILLPKLTSPLVAMYGVLALLASNGLASRALQAGGIANEPVSAFPSLTAVVLGETLIVAPYPILMLASALHSADRSLEEAARTLGASPWRAFLAVPFRLTLPALVLATLVTLIWSLGAFTAPVILGNPELYPIGVEVFSVTFDEVNWPLGAALSMTNLFGVTAVAVVALALHRRTERTRWLP